MKLIFEKDRIRWQAETCQESLAVLALHDLVFFSNCPEEIANDHGMNGRALNFCCTPLPLSSTEGVAACVAMNGQN